MIFICTLIPMLSITSVLHAKPSFFLHANLTNAIDVYSVRSQEINWVCKEAIRHVHAKNPGFSLFSWGDMYKLWAFTRLTESKCVCISAKLINRMALTLWCTCVWIYFFPFGRFLAINVSSRISHNVPAIQP